VADVQISNLKKSYGSVVALHDISLSIPEGAFFTLLGPSGCGKTTLLRTIAGFHRQDQGSISVGSERLDAVPVHLRDVGMVFQDYAIFPHLSVEKNVAFGLKQRRLRGAEIRKRVYDILKVVQLEQLSGRMPHELSGGQQQRVGLARALVTRPKVMLMDEPLSNLDAQLRIDLRQELRTLQQQLGITTVYVTHDQEEALEMSDLVCVMHKGVIQHSGTPWAIYHEPANRFVASFVGSNNFLTVQQERGMLSLCGLSFSPGKSILPTSGNESLIASIRPENITLCLDGAQATQTDTHIRLPATLQYRSFAGRELRLTALAADGSKIQFISEPRPEYLELAENASIHLRIDKNKVSFFSAGDDGVRLR